MSEKENKKVEKTEEAEVKAPSIQDIINNYPIDRERARDVLLLSISNGVSRIANALEYFANKDVTEESAKKIPGK